MKIWSRCIAQNMNEKFEKLCPKYLGQNFSKNFVHILGNATTCYFHSEISWPLTGCYFITEVEMTPELNVTSIKLFLPILKLKHVCTITLRIMVLNLISCLDTLLVQNRSIRFICCFWKKPEHAAQITDSLGKKNSYFMFQVPIGTIYLALNCKLHNLTYFCYAQRL